MNDVDYHQRNSSSSPMKNSNQSSTTIYSPKEIRLNWLLNFSSATKKFGSVYPILKEVALVRVPGSRTMKKVSQQTLTFALKAVGKDQHVVYLQMGRQPYCDKVGLKRGPWTIEEDRKLMTFILENGILCWRAIPNLAGGLRLLLISLVALIIKSRTTGTPESRTTGTPEYLKGTLYAIHYVTMMIISLRHRWPTATNLHAVAIYNVAITMLNLGYYNIVL